MKKWLKAEISATRLQWSFFMVGIGVIFSPIEVFEAFLLLVLIIVFVFYAKTT